MSMTTQLNVYQKLNALREKVHGKIGKDGKNTYAKYSYFRLDDILNIVAPVMVEIGLIDTTSFTWDATRNLFVLQATLVNTDNPVDTITANFEILHDNIKGQTGQQATGSSNTYARRYVWQQWLALTEPNSDPDEINASQKVQRPIAPSVPAPDMATVKTLAQNAYGDDYDTTKLAVWASGGRVNTLDKLNDDERAKLAKSLEKKIADTTE